MLAQEQQSLHKAIATDFTPQCFETDADPSGNGDISKAMV